MGEPAPAERAAPSAGLFGALLSALATQLRDAEVTLERLQAVHERDLLLSQGLDVKEREGAKTTSLDAARNGLRGLFQPGGGPLGRILASDGEVTPAARLALVNGGEEDVREAAASPNGEEKSRHRPRYKSVWGGREPPKLVAPMATFRGLGPWIEDSVADDDHHAYPSCDVPILLPSCGAARLALTAACPPPSPASSHTGRSGGGGDVDRKVAIGEVVLIQEVDDEEEIESLASTSSASSDSFHLPQPSADDEGSEDGDPGADLELHHAWGEAPKRRVKLNTDVVDIQPTQAMIAQYVQGAASTSVAGGVVRKWTTNKRHATEKLTLKLGVDSQGAWRHVGHADSKASKGTNSKSTGSRGVDRSASTVAPTLTRLTPVSAERTVMELRGIWGGQVKDTHSSDSPGLVHKKRTLGSRRITLAGLVPAFNVSNTDTSEGPAPKRQPPCQRFVMEPSAPFSMLWSVLEMLLLLYDLLTVPMFLSNLAPPPNPFTDNMKFVSMSFWNADLVASFFKGYITENGEVELRWRRIVSHYVRTRFLWDLVLVLIEWVNFILGQLFNAASSTKMLRLVRVSRLIKIGKMNRVVNTLSALIRSNWVYTLLSMAKTVLLILVGNHMIACAWYWVSDGSNRQLDDSGAPFAEKYSEALHWSLSQLGFGTTDVYPRTTWERIFANLVAIVSLVSLAFLVGGVVTGLLRLQLLMKEQLEKEDRLRDYLNTHRVGWPLRSRIWNFLRINGIAQHKVALEQSVELLRMLPKAMAVELRAEVFIPILLVHPFFATYAISQADKAGMHHIIQKKAVQEVGLLAEHELFAPGDAGSHMYFLLHGSLSYRVSARQRQGKDPRYPRQSVDSMISDFGSATVALGPGEWLCEPALWIRWTHVGSASAKVPSELLGLEAEKFQGIMQQYLPEAQRYAAQFLQYAQDRTHQMDDVYFDIICLRKMAQDVFEAPSWLDLDRCRPQGEGPSGQDEWQPSNRRQWQRVWTSPWKAEHLQNRSTMLVTMTTDLKHDVVLVYQTLFPQSHNDGFPCPWLTTEEVRLFDLRVMFLKRLLLCYATCGLCFTTERNGQTRVAWPYPLASVLCHGGRVLIRLSGVPWREFVNFLIFGEEAEWSWEERGVPSPLYGRRAASHSVRMDARTFELYELKVKRLSALGSCHFGMDIPLGGLGNPAPQNKAGQLYIGPSGTPFRRARHSGSAPQYLTHVQHGHIYLRGDDFPSINRRAPASSVQERQALEGVNSEEPELSSWANALRGGSGYRGSLLGSHGPRGSRDSDQAEPPRERVNSVLIGVESSAPLREDLFGHTHSPEAKSNEVSAFGKRKWRDYGKCGQDVPADLGGIRASVNEVQFQRLRELCASLHLSKPSEAAGADSELQLKERRLFQDLLQSSLEDEVVEGILENYVNQVSTLDGFKM